MNNADNACSLSDLPHRLLVDTRDRGRVVIAQLDQIDHALADLRLELAEQLTTRPHRAHDVAVALDIVT